ncbi:MAG: hypothetical protein DWH79_02805 [Planctomycetota bacterium]|nr:MAG: hypothetical protein DWH79_02805 [Planctomycetota bacterium]
MRRSREVNSRRPGGSVSLLLSVVVLASCGCGGPPARPGARAPDRLQAPAAVAPQAPPAARQISQEVRDKLLDGAMDVLGNLEAYDESAAFAQVFDRLNQWIHVVAAERTTAAVVGTDGPGGADQAALASDGWHADQLLASLPERLRSADAVEALDDVAFNASADIAALRDQRWLADIAATARGDALDDLEVARRLFDWTIRSLAIQSDPPMVPTETTPGSRWFHTGEILLAGRASAAQRAWVFLELVRHSGLDGVMLATGDAESGTLRPWIPAVLCGAEAHLFDPGYGMPIPGPGGEGVATARQAAADPSVLAAMSLPDRPYPIQAADIGRLSVLVAATPWNLSRRMQLLDRHLAGSRRIDLAIDASAIAARALAALPEAIVPSGNQAHQSPAEGRQGLWEFPWETLARRASGSRTVDIALVKELAVMAVAFEQSNNGRDVRSFRPLYAARIREFRGDLDGPDGAKVAYLMARPGNATISDVVKGFPPQQADGVKRMYDEMKADATYWLGVLTLGEGEFETAVDYLERMTLLANPEGVWADAARANLARARIGLGQTDEAARLLRDDASSQRFGSRLIAARIAPAAP